MADPQTFWFFSADVRFHEGELLDEVCATDFSGAFAHRHDASVWECLRQILRITPRRSDCQHYSVVAIFHGRIGPRGAHWASWADCPLRVREKQSTVVDTMVQAQAGDTVPCFMQSECT